MGFKVSSVVSGSALLAALTVGGCASDAPFPPAGMQEKIVAARSPADHADIAALYEQQAGRDKAAAEQHRRIAQAYRGRISRAIPPGMAAHCENLATLYETAAKENLALAEQHRRAAKEQ